ncbi:MAG: T9SS type A sorting domain-containing protein [Ignavibacteria bacterium]
MKLKTLLLITASAFLIFFNANIPSQSIINSGGIIFESSVKATIVDQDGMVMRTDNGGSNWVQQPSNITNVLNSIDFVNYVDINNNPVNMKLIACENGVILKSTNDGSSWNIILSGTLENLNDIVIYSPQLIYACGNNGTLLRSTDYAQTWVPVSTGTPNALNHMVILSAGSTKLINAIAVGNNGACYATSNLMNWYAVTLPTTENIQSIASSENVIVCGTTGGNIIKSTNRGSTWVVISSGITSTIYELVFSNTRTVFGCSENGVILRSKDKGESWAIITTPTKFDLLAMDFGTELFGIATGGFGYSVFTTDGGSSWNNGVTYQFAGKLKKDEVKLTQNYPNPFNPSTIISYTVNDYSNISIRVYDINGKEVKTLVNTFQNTGTYSVNFNASNLSSGIYFYVLRVNNGTNEITKTMKMTLTK